MKKLYDLKKAYSFAVALLKSVVIIFIISLVIFSLIFDLQLDQLSSALEKLNPLTKTEEYRINNISFAESSYQNGFLEFSASDLKENDEIMFTDESDIEESKRIIISNQSIYKIVEGDLILIGSLDDNFDGKNGSRLRINFSNNLPGAEIKDDGQLNDQLIGWKAVNKEVKFGEDKIAGLKTPKRRPELNNSAESIENTNQYMEDGDFKVEINANKADSSDYAVKLFSENIKAENSQGLVRGPSVHSDKPIYLSSGDKLLFDWKAEAGTDAYSIYGYLVDINTNQIQVILDQRGKDAHDSSSWNSEKIRISKTGEYLLVFVGGSYDFTGGRAVGAQIYLNNIRIDQKSSPALVTAEDLNNLTKKIVIRKTGTPFSADHLKIRVKNSSGQLAEEIISLNNEKNNIVFAQDKDSLDAADQNKDNLVQPKKNFVLEKYNHKDPERVDKLIINSSQVQNKYEDRKKAENKENFRAVIYADQNKNGIVDPGEAQVAEAAQITFKAESIYKDEKGNYHLLINPESETDIALNLVLDLESIDFSKINRRDSSPNYIIEIKIIK